MRRLPLRLLPLTMLVLIAGCGGEPPPEGTFEMTLNGEELGFADGISATASKGEDLKLLIVGRDDPMPDAIDDERTIYLHIAIDSSELSTLEGAGPVRVHGTLNAPTSEEADLTFDPQQDHEAAIRSVYLEVSCFCSVVQSETQSFDGTLELRKREDGRLDVTVGLDAILDQTRGYDPSTIDYHFETRMDAHFPVEVPEA